MVDVGFPSTAPRFLPVQRKMRTPAPSRSPKSMSASGSASCISDSAASELSSEVPNPPKRQKQQQKQRASPEPKDGSSRFNSRARNKRKFVGVRQRPSGRWVAEIKDTTQKIRLWLGTFNTAEDAARAYDEAACLIRGANTRTNFVSSSNFDTGHLRSKAAQTLLLSRGITSIASKGGKNIVFPVKRENEVITQEDTPVISQGISNNSRMEEDEGSVCLPSSSSGSDCALDSSSPIAQTSSPFVRHDDQKNLEQHFEVSKSPAHDSAFDGLCKEEAPVLGCWDSWPSDRKKEPFIGHRHEGKLGYSFYSPDAYASDALSCWGEKTDNSFEGSYSSPFDFCAEITLPNTFDEIPLMPGLHSEQEPMMDFELPEDNLKEHIKRVKYEKQSLASLFVMNSVQERLLPRSTSTATVPVPSPTSFTSSSSSSCTSSGFNQSSQKVYYPVPHRSSSNDASPVEAPSSKSAFSKEDNNSGSDCSSQEPLLWDLAPFCVGDIYRFDR